MPNLYQKLLISSFFIQVMPLATTCGIAPAQAQITPDNTLGGESSQFNQNVLINNILGDKIDGGATRGSNLFHSFSQFNINDAQRVYFANPSGVLNILTRVTGGNVSNIFGTLGVDGGANLFLINPNGILFGQNAKLDVGGSFVGTTANRIQFGNQGFFSATNPEAPPLLTINPSALVFNQINPNASIQNNSVADLGPDPSNTFTATGLRVPDGNSLLLVGGDVKMNNGRLYAFGGRVELGGLAAPGTVGLNGSGSNLSLSFPNGVTLGDVSISNVAGVGVAASNGGSIGINARNLELAEGSFLYAGIGDGLGTVASKAGNIDINAQGTIDVKNGAQINASTRGRGNAGNVTITARDAVTISGTDSGIFSDLGSGAEGRGGDINILGSGSVSVTNGGQLSAETSGKGNAGNITINSQGLVFFDKAGSDNSTGAFSNVYAGAVGNGGTVKIDTGSVDVKNGAQINAFTRGTGDAGNVTITARDSVVFDGVASNGNPSAAYSSVNAGSVGNGGTVNIDAGSLLSLTNGGQLGALVRRGDSSNKLPGGRGNAGTVNVKVRDAVTISGTDSGIFSDLGSGAEGRGGNINILGSGSVSVTNGGQLSAETSGTGDAGNITINSQGLVFFDKASSNNSTGAFSNVQTTGVGKAGGVNIDAGSVEVKNGAGINAFTSGTGDAGNVTITARDAVVFDGADRDGYPSAALSSVEPGAVGNAGTINIDAGSLSLTNGGLLSAFVRQADTNSKPGGRGDGGSVNVKVRDALTISGESANDTQSGIFSSLGFGAEGRGGNINIYAGLVSVTNGGQLSAETSGKGDGGNITINSQGLVFFDQAGSNNFTGATSTVQAGAVGNGGTVKIDAGSVEVKNGAQINALTGGIGDAGNVTITARDAVVFDGVDSNGNPSGATSTVQAGAVGNGGGVNINASSISVKNGAQINALTGGIGDAGNVTINAYDAVLFDGVGSNGNPSGATSTVQAGAVGNVGRIKIGTRTLSIANGAVIRATSYATFGNSGNITLEIGDLLLLRNNSLISASASGAGDGGNIRINAPNGFVVGVSNENSDITANAGIGNGGNVNIDAAGIYSLAPLTSQELKRLRPDDSDPRKLQTNDITAVSQEKPELSGQVNINTLYSDPNRAFFTLSTGVVEPSTLIASGCGAFGGGGSEFTVTGRGGLPRSPDDLLTGDAIWTDARLTNIVGDQKPKASVPTPSKVNTVEIVPATGWVFNGKGQVTLISNVSSSSPHQTGSSPTCQQR
ncbi:MAG: filamentous hemagglutinin N-terminal domain-containing protein [Cyanomargarita calcarea GSE-NOS-MK-12-04C]|uniref:Filamentous hemagglutinin N-terminal domain-containing protein n=1 Tax=Cyanomargarita calcarea GSE-NOS-MK-12-04C TaxID=2839659 RepID=A0A951QYH3_9CYAN|nr:filamentous hemagglutinin N-terminal domain-containing protein [Cyanomargarita calcarea GSE-NOS-MK-12-04C]